MAAILILTLAACRDEAVAPSEGRPVRVVTVEAGKLSSDIKLSGEIRAEKNVGLAFRIGGRVLERNVNVGDRVAAGQVVARLDPTLERNELTAAKAALQAARGEVNTARNTFERQERLMAQGFTTRPRFDQALKAEETAQAQLENAEAQLELAQDRLGFTELRAGIAGIVTARTIEPGEVVQPGQVVIQLAREDGRDAVFNVPARLLETQVGDSTIRVSLADAPTVTALGRIREVSPQADPVTRTFTVKVGLIDPPAAMQLGATVVGTLEVSTAAIITIPASALTQQGQSPAVWIVDPAASTVSLRNVDILRFDPDDVIVSQGLEPGEIIVSEGIQALHPGQRIRQLSKMPEPGRTAAARRPAVPPS
ncbi:efflux RND transporter periplasmic adaptor subunit [Chelatococcus asaccharovorans]|uniref:efflux RND transporter periplasmic adaptor subunit n=1 Tax=Chelatococcus asaccharovorans TaxID=28210 RepID=UPI0022649DCA|nr:efflux RND transporter periplasmic adaptor subunit [Chelatococcus asaccharovorans]